MTIFTVGHSNVSIERFLTLLRQHTLAVLVDARSLPHSRYAPQFNRKALQASLLQVGLKYLYLGDRLGGRPADPTYHRPDGSVDYDRLAETPWYREGLQRLKQEADTARVAIMCSEADYRKCHRHWLIARSLVREGIDVQHILHSGALAQTSADEFAPTVDQLRLW